MTGSMRLFPLSKAITRFFSDYWFSNQRFCWFLKESNIQTSTHCSKSLLSHYVSMCVDMISCSLQTKTLMVHSPRINDYSSPLRLIGLDSFQNNRFSI